MEVTVFAVPHRRARHRHHLEMPRMAALLEHQVRGSILLRLDRGGETRLTSRSSGLTRAAILCDTGSPRWSVRPDLDKGWDSKGDVRKTGFVCSFMSSILQQ